MQPNEQAPSVEDQYTHILKLISAIAYGDARVEDIAAQLRNEGLDALDVVLTLVARASAAPMERMRAQKPINLQDFSKLTPPDLVAQIVHRVPRLPFILNGTLYDPQDISRFDGHELHLIATAAGEPIIAVDDREVMAQWWRATYLTSLSRAAQLSAAENYRYGGYKFGGEPQDSGLIIIVPPPAYAPQTPGGRVPAQTTFYEDNDYRGDSLSLAPNKGYSDLTEVGRGVFNWGDWNDIISSFSMIGTTMCVLWDHSNWQGNSFSVLMGASFSYRALDSYGWNDRASSLGTW